MNPFTRQLPGVTSICNAAAEIFLHGYGSSANQFRDCFALTSKPAGTPQLWLDGLEHDRVTGMRRWFPFTARKDALANSIIGSAPVVETMAQNAMVSVGLPTDSPVIMVGHSQGGMLCLSLALRQRLNIVGVRVYAAFLPEDLCVALAHPSMAPVSFSIFSSSKDEWVLPGAVEQTVSSLSALKRFTVLHRLSNDLPHRFSHEWLDEANFSGQEMQ